MPHTRKHYTGSHPSSTRNWVGTTRSKHVGRCPTTSKAQFVTRDDAKDCAKKYGDTARPFKCEDCGYFHLGHLYGQDREWHRDLHQKED